ncbi:hypothetical protein QJS66_23720 (plasmid) [Kocuria rhizophila]|nr:hypothetical protein QJS66_23720 [Kocuria rhizophila]
MGESSARVSRPSEWWPTEHQDRRGQRRHGPKTGKPEKELTYVMVSVFDVGRTEEVAG